MSLTLERVRELCLSLGLDALANDFSGLAERAAKDELSFTDFLERGLRLEQQSRLERSRTLLTRIAGFPAIKTLEDYDFEFASGAPKTLIQELASLAFVERQENVVLLGPSGDPAGPACQNTAGAGSPSFDRGATCFSRADRDTVPFPGCRSEET